MPMPDGEHPTLGQIRGIGKWQRRAVVWAFLKAIAQVEMRQTYERAVVLPGLTQVEIIGMLADAAVRVGLAMLDKLEGIDLHKRGKGGKNHGRQG